MASRKSTKYHRRNYTLDDDTVTMATEIATAAGLPVSALFRLLVRQAYQQQAFTVRKESLNQSVSA
jgi:hypothetical protein